MGKISSETPNETTINHFSHPHPLKLHNCQSQQTLIPSSCSGCKLQVSGLTYSCTTCNYFLHKKCSEMPQKINHPFHQQHVFSLLPKPIYPNGCFNCDACGQVGNGFSYHCKVCTLDMHILCAVMPLSLTHASHPHKLNLVFECPYPTKSFSCDICTKEGSNHWLYRCSSCGFDAHLNCAKGAPPSSPQLPPMQQNPTNFTSFQSQTPMPQAFTSFLPQTPTPQAFTSFQPQTPMPQGFTSFQPQTPMPQSFTSFQPQTPMPGMNNVSFGIPAAPVMPNYGNRQNNGVFLQTLEQIYSNAQQTLMATTGGGGGRETQQLLQMFSNLNINGGGSGGIPGLDPSGGGSIPNFDAFGGGVGGQNYLQAFMNSGGDGGLGGGGGLDILQSLLGGGNGLDLLGGGGGLLDTLGGLGEFL
ncbi:Cysteine/Histidine-rich C1 domain family protein [Abeliophyllum distichum]|uniref:Cysteine/Histidine-rich C1 domain family protein n=1 Tax=Abeliophyllum distichum TaxID=126358 RepID=A0ABD1PBP4_9LAMI